MMVVFFMRPPLRSTRALNHFAKFESGWCRNQSRHHQRTSAGWR
jgi:hypothetical protein